MGALLSARATPLLTDRQGLSPFAHLPLEALRLKKDREVWQKLLNCDDDEEEELPPFAVPTGRVGRSSSPLKDASGERSASNASIVLEALPVSELIRPA